MKTGVYGGTFNPVHNGHLRLAQTYLTALELDRMLVIPTRVPPHKAVRQLADGADRLEMCRRAFTGPEYLVSDIELRREGQKSYTVDTLELLHERYSGDELYLVMGSDMFLTLTEWYHWERIFELAVMCVGAREPNLRERLAGHGRYLCALGARCRVVDLEPLVISSTGLRERIRRGEGISGLVPPAVEAYIKDRMLYCENI